MDYEYSPHRSGGTLHLLSPTHSQFGVPALQQLRRSLSRSPSKPSRFQIRGKVSPTSPLSPSSLSTTYTHETSSASIASNIRPKFTLKRSAPSKSETSRRTSPNNSIRRALTDGTNTSNAARISLPFRGLALGQENARQAHPEVPKLMRFELDNEPIKFDLLKAHADKPGSLHTTLREHMTPVKSSPLKRSDGLMNLDTPNHGSPCAKRRSLHGAMLGSDFELWEHGGDGLAMGRRTSHEDSTAVSTPQQKSPQRRPFSLRRSTLQQRPGAVLPKARPTTEVSIPPASPRPAMSSTAIASRARYRMSLDGSLPLRALEQMSFPQSSATAAQPGPPRFHPLSHTLSQSSSSNSLVDEPPTPVPPTINPQDRPLNRRSKASFSRSLPIGALRPKLDDSGNGVSDSDAFETPDNFKSARPLPAAFMSTGLISKRNRNTDMPSSMFGSSTNMPDTPSKKTMGPHVSNTPMPSSSLGKVTRPTHEFGSPTTPFSPHAHKGSPESFGKGVSIFGSRVAQGRLIRRASFLSIESDDVSPPSTKMDTQASIDDLPPTPTKPAQIAPRPQSKGRGNSLRSSLLGRRSSLAPDTFTQPETSITTRHNQAGQVRTSSSSQSHSTLERSEDILTTSRTPFFTLSSSTDAGTLSRPHPNIVERSPSPLSDRAKTPTPMRPNSAEITIQVAPYSVHSNVLDGPLTPQESSMPTDTNHLGINSEHRTLRQSVSTGASFPPATPTGPRDSAFAFSSSVGPGNSSMLQNDVDTTLTSRFGNVSVYGIGEFSIVYRVENPLQAGPSSSQNPENIIGKVWVVKKSKKPYAGSKDRSRKMKEVQILKALRGNEHIVEQVDTWEMKNHLYIQTEFCENGNLKDFLSQTGFKARLDDFRIWKILLELSQGVKCIHDAGYIHLDLKPANVFIDWEGVLKIGDFGMASVWPAPPHLDGEGDREYIAPEVLSGRFDRPADVFALGMIMLEIAGNIVLPDNGTSWQRLRTGDMSDLPSLTFSSESTLVRDESGDPVGMLDDLSNETLITPTANDENDLGFCSRRMVATPRARDLVQPPNFMVDNHDPHSLERLVQALISPNPDHRPTIQDVVSDDSVCWISNRRRAGATIYEGNWGPADDVVHLSDEQDVDMLDA